MNNDNTFNIIEGLANSNPNQEVNETTLREAFTGLSELRDLIREAIEKGVLDKISHTSRNVLNSHFYQIERNAKNSSIVIQQYNALLYQVQIINLQRLVFEDLAVEAELKELTYLRRRYSRLLKNIERAEDLYGQLSKIDSSVKNMIKGIETSKKHSDNYRAELDSIRAEIEKSKTSISKSEQAIEDRKDQVLEFVNNIDESQKSLDTIESELRGQIEKELEEKIAKASKLIEQAEKALELKNTEGISAAYSSRLKKLSEKRAKAYWLFGAIFFVFLLLITGYLLMGGKLFGIENAFKRTENVALIIGRIFFSAIAISGAVFCAKRYVVLKNLEEDYEYKVVLSKSILAFGNKIKELDKERVADYLTKVLNDLHQDPLRDRSRKHSKKSDFENIEKITELIKKWKDIKA